MRLRARDGRLLRVAHRGAADGARENSLAAVEAAVALDVDLVEVDVAHVGGELVLAHSPAVAGPHTPTLDEALAFFTASAPAPLGLQLDVKAPREATRVVAAVRAHGLEERTVLSCTAAAVLREVRRLEPRIPVGIGYPRDSRGVVERGLVPEAVLRAVLAGLRATLPARIGGLLARAQADAAFLHHLVVSPAVVSRCHARGVAVLAWTVNEAADLERVAAAGVDGVVTDRPELLASVD